MFQQKDIFVRNYGFDGLKLLFITLIVLHHTVYLPDYLHHGYMGVDFFFMVSGYMQTRTTDLKPKLTTWAYFRNRLQKLYPHYFLSFVIMLLSTSIYRSGGFRIQTFLDAIPEMLMIQNLGIFPGGTNYPCWYISVLMAASVVLFFLRKHLLQRWFRVLNIGCVLITYGFMLIYTGGSMETFDTIFVWYLPFWRGVAGMLAGGLIYETHAQMRFGNRTKFFAVLEVICLLTIAGLMFAPQNVDGIILFLIFLLLLSIGDPKSQIRQKSDCWLVRWGSRYEYAVFLNHAFVIGVFKKLIRGRFGIPKMCELALMLVLVLVYSIFTTLAVEKAVSVIRRYRCKV